MFRIGVLRLSSLGDTILVSPILKALKVTFPEAHLSLLIKKDYAPVFFNHPSLDQIIELDTLGQHQGAIGLYRFVRQHRNQEYDLFLDLHDNLRSRIITFGIQARRKMRYRKHHWQRWAMVHLRRITVEPRHTVDLYFDTLKPLGVDTRDRCPEIFLTHEEIQQARLSLDTAGLKAHDRLVGVHVGAVGEAKRWLPEYFSSVLSNLYDRGWVVALFGTEEDKPFLEAVGSGLSPGPVVFSDLALRELMGLIDQCAVLLCHDSGPMHMAVARKVPVVALFGPTHPKLGFSPLGEDDVIMTADAECSPCSLHGTKPCHRKRKTCLEEIRPEEVTAAILRLGERKKELANVR